MEFLQYIQKFDSAFVNCMSQYTGNALFDSIMSFVSLLGNHGIVWIILGIIMIVSGKKYRKWGILLLICLGCTAVVVNLFLKPYVARIRPFDALSLSIIIKQPLDASFPSGHSAAAFAAAAVFLKMDKRMGIIMTAFGVMMAFSRLYLLVHYPSDVLAGAFLGAVISSIVLYIINKKWVIL